MDIWPLNNQRNMGNMYVSLGYLAPLATGEEYFVLGA